MVECVQAGCGNCLFLTAMGKPSRATTKRRGGKKYRYAAKTGKKVRVCGKKLTLAPTSPAAYVARPWNERRQNGHAI